jgi:hypothetical protein
MSVEFRPVEPLRISPPKVLVRACIAEGSNTVFPDYDVTRDSNRFVFSCFAQGANRRSVTVAVGWQQMVKWPGATRP